MGSPSPSIWNGEVGGGDGSQKEQCSVGFLLCLCCQDEKEKKRLEQLERKKELQRLAEEEMNSLKGAKANPTKVTRALIQANQEQLAAEGQYQL